MGSSCCRACQRSNDAENECSHCHFPLRLLEDFLAAQPKNWAGRRVFPLGEHAENLSYRVPITSAHNRFSLQPGTVHVLGSRLVGDDSGNDSCRFHLNHVDVEEDHALILTSSTGKAWLINLASSPATVNGKYDKPLELTIGDLLQIGPFGWTYDEKALKFQPFHGLRGLALDIDAAVPERLLQTQLQIPAQQMVAIVGPSGCGKSTLLDEVRLQTGLNNTDLQPGDIYFMPQKDLVHEDLRLQDTLKFVADFYGVEVLPADMDECLRSVGLDPEIFRDRFPAKLSGGQLRRFRIACALISGRGAIVLDEPDSGLDHDTATEIVTVLRTVALRGVTVIAITHHQHVLDSFDRIIELEKKPQGGRVKSDTLKLTQQETASAPQSRPHLNWNRQTALLIGREFKEFVWGHTVWASSKFGRWIPGCLLTVVLVPFLFAVAVSFAVPTDAENMVGVDYSGAELSIEYGKQKFISLFVFMSVVSVVWMSASLSHLTFAKQRELYNHERTLGVSWPCLLAAKGVVFSFASIIQTLVFILFMHLLRHEWLRRSYFVSEYDLQLSETYLIQFLSPWIVVALIFASLAATALGLLISVSANRRPLTAAAILPVVMMVQILFSATFSATSPGSYEKMEAYRQLSRMFPDNWNNELETKQSALPPAIEWADKLKELSANLPEGWRDSLNEFEETTYSKSDLEKKAFKDQFIKEMKVSDDLEEDLKRLEDSRKKHDADWEPAPHPETFVLTRLRDHLEEVRQNESAIEKERYKLANAYPLKLTSTVSYMTLTRYADQWLQSFAVVRDKVEDVEDENGENGARVTYEVRTNPITDHATWRNWGIGGLLFWTVVYYCVAVALFPIQAWIEKLLKKYSFKQSQKQDVANATV